jgi:hypothetical protein
VFSHCLFVHRRFTVCACNVLHLQFALNYLTIQRIIYVYFTSGFPHKTAPCRFSAHTEITKVFLSLYIYFIPHILLPRFYAYYSFEDIRALTRLEQPFILLARTRRGRGRRTSSFREGKACAREATQPPRRSRSVPQQYHNGDLRNRV